MTKKHAILDYLLEYLLDKKTQDIVNFLKTSRGDSEEEKILRHPTETTELNGVVRRRNRTNAELIGFKNGDAPDNVANPKERLQYLNNVIKDLTVDYVHNIVLDNYFDMPAFIVDEDQEQLDDDDIYYNDIYY